MRLLDLFTYVLLLIMQLCSRVRVTHADVCFGRCAPRLSRWGTQWPGFEAKPTEKTIDDTHVQ